MRNRRCPAPRCGFSGPAGASSPFADWPPPRTVREGQDDRTGPASEQIPEWLKRATMGILPLRSDVFLDFAFPNKLPELIVIGKPVIVRG